jgi:hypothetical protein
LFTQYRYFWILFQFKQIDDGGGYVYLREAFGPLPIIFILAATFVVVSNIFSNLFNAMVGAGLLLAGIPIYRYWNSQQE